MSANLEHYTSIHMFAEEVRNDLVELQSRSVIMIVTASHRVVARQQFEYVRGADTELQNRAFKMFPPRHRQAATGQDDHERQ